MDRNRSLINRSPFGRIGTAAFVAVPIVFLASFFLYPVVMITLRGLSVAGEFGLAVVREVL